MQQVVEYLLFHLRALLGALVEMASASYTLIFSLNTGIIKKLLSKTRNKKKKHNKILTLAKSKLNSIEVLVSQALIDMDISQEEFVVILNHKNKYQKMKERLKNTSENMRLNNTGSKKITNLQTVYFVILKVFFVYIKCI